MKRIFRRSAAVVILVGVVVAVVASGATARSSANIQVCVLLPDTKSSVRWVQFDAPYFAKALKKAKVTYSITNALNDPQKMVSQADSCLSRHAKVAIVTDIAQGTSIAIEKKFARAGGLSIDYDRQVVGGIAKVYVSFDGKKVGAGSGQRCRQRSQGQVEAGRRRALGRTDGSERVLVQERERRRSEPAVQERQAEQGAAAVRAAVVGDERAADLRADAAPDEQQDRRRHRRERQHRRRCDRRPEGEEAEADRRCRDRTRPCRACRTSSRAGRR